MFTKNTVLVLGAGASAHYGYPTGEELVDGIVEAINKDTLKSEQYHNARLSNSKLSDIQELNQLSKHLDFYDPLSIDSFLSDCAKNNNLSMVDAGKTMIVYKILKAEDSTRLERLASKRENKFDGKLEKNNWYRFLQNAITTNAASAQQLIDEELKLRIITFNYDNSLEYFLYSRCLTSPLLMANSNKFLQKIRHNIIHIYGQVGRFKWKGGNNRENDDYGSYANKNTYRKAKEWKDSVFVIGEERNGKVHSEVTSNAAEAQNWLDWAEVIFFLGFGFNDDNIKLLDLSLSAVKAKKIFCTNLGNSKIINEKIETLFNRGEDGSKVMTLQKKEQYVNSRKAEISVRSVYDCLDKDFTLLQ